MKYRPASSRCCCCVPPITEYAYYIAQRRQCSDTAYKLSALLPIPACPMPWRNSLSFTGLFSKTPKGFPAKLVHVRPVEVIFHRVYGHWEVSGGPARSCTVNCSLSPSLLSLHKVYLPCRDRHLGMPQHTASANAQRLPPGHTISSGAHNLRRTRHSATAHRRPNINVTHRLRKHKQPGAQP